MFRLTRRAAPRRTRAQSIVEFGLVAVIFALMLSAIFDFGILLNGWLGVSSSARDLARQAAVGVCPAGNSPCSSAALVPPRLPTNLSIQGVDPQPTTGQPIVVKVVACPGDGTVCDNTNTGFMNDLWSAYINTVGTAGSCTTGCKRPQAGDVLAVSVVAQIQVITPLVRPAFGCLNGNNPRCDVRISSTNSIRYEGSFIQ
jgi:hypothetical protein